MQRPSHGLREIEVIKNLIWGFTLILMGKWIDKIDASLSPGMKDLIKE